MSRAKKCVVSSSCNRNVQSLVEPLRATQQRKDLKPHTWAQYSLANYFANKSDIIDRYKCDRASFLDELYGVNICTGRELILRSIQIITSSLHLLLGLKESDNKKSFLNLFANGGQVSIWNKIIPHQREIESKTECHSKSSISKGNCYQDGNFDENSIPKLDCPSIRRQSRHQQSPQFLVILAIIISVQNALPCSGFMFPLRYDNTGFIGYNYPYESPSLSTMNTALWNNPTRNLNQRNNDDPMLLMSTSRDSFTNDQTSQPQTSPAPTLKSWTSMLTNAFGTQQRDALDDHIKKILVPRVSGTEGIVKVRDYITNVLRANKYHIELDEFTDSTPVGHVKFSNIIASSNPDACRQLVLACHYDSKMMDGFLGAVDSAVPCAMLLKISETFNKAFRPTTDDSGDSKESLGLRFIFFDGEEAFEQWSATDSLYGSRHLAERWSKQPAPNQCPVQNELGRIELFVLLDLIGSSDTSFVMYSVPLKHHYNDMQKYEKQYLANKGLSTSQARRETAFKGRYLPLDFVEDDHVPFKKRGVPILSLLANPFPKVWHTVDDNYSAIDFARTRRILYVLEQFVANYKKEAD